MAGLEERFAAEIQKARQGQDEQGLPVHQEAGGRRSRRPPGNDPGERGPPEVPCKARRETGEEEPEMMSSRYTAQSPIEKSRATPLYRRSGNAQEKVNGSPQTFTWADHEYLISKFAGYFAMARAAGLGRRLPRWQGSLVSCCRPISFRAVLPGPTTARRSCRGLKARGRICSSGPRSRSAGGVRRYPGNCCAACVGAARMPDWFPCRPVLWVINFLQDVAVNPTSDNLFPFELIALGVLMDDICTCSLGGRLACSRVIRRAVGRGEPSPLRLPTFHPF